ncbi:unnamed protein product [Owenia fusiformis]|uniref:Uncharacterized protein n=1 Tax=Owenia fusiformis TaxID=6347 RepID=A0A8S4NNA4_OWEFU|nr:unnamed protein product [Owenia fusiformis]
MLTPSEQRMDLNSANMTLAKGPMNFSENQQGNVILDKLRLQKDNGRFCDIVFHVDEKQYLAHRNVLAACSPYFDSMLKINRVAKEHLSVTCTNHEIFELLLDYMYTGSVQIHNNNVRELLKLANHFLISNLRSYCGDYLEQSMDHTNCFSIKELASKSGLNKLLENSENFIKQNWSQIILQNEILEFTQSQLEIFMRNSELLSEEEKFRIILSWVKTNVKQRDTILIPLLAKIDWAKINPGIILSTLQEDLTFTQNEKLLYYLLKALHDNGIAFQEYMGMYTKLQEKYDLTSQDLEDEGNNLLQIAVSEAIGAVNEFVENDCKSEITVTPYRAMDQAAMQQIYQPPGSKDNDLGPIVEEGRKRRKGIPIKVKISKAKIEKALKKRGRKRKLKEAKPTVSKKEKPEIVKAEDAASENNESQKEDALNEMNDIDTKDDVDEDWEKDIEENDDSDLDEDYNIADDQISPKQKKRRRRFKNRKDTDGPIKCMECNYKAPNPSRLELHMNSVHKDDITYTCNLCDHTCKWNREHHIHMKSHFDGPPYKCDNEECDYSSERIQLLLIHRMKHTDERPFSCPMCNFRFRTKNNLRTHMRCHTGEKPFKCSICGRRFATKNTLMQHSVTHSDHRPYLCDLCGFSTKYQSHLIAHKRIHTGNVFKCQEANCKYSTPKRSQLKCHMRSHLCIRSHICSVCGRGFVEKSHLVRHERIHMDDKAFKCEQCDYGSSRRDKLKEHVLKHHGDNATAKTPYKPRRPRTQKQFSYPGMETSPSYYPQAQVESPVTLGREQVNFSNMQLAGDASLHESKEILMSNSHQHQTPQSHVITDYRPLTVDTSSISLASDIRTSSVSNQSHNHPHSQGHLDMKVPPPAHSQLPITDLRVPHPQGLQPVQLMSQLEQRPPGPGGYHPGDMASFGAFMQLF